MSDDSPFAEWYQEGKPLPVCHPIPHCSATVTFPTAHTIEWEVTNHKTGETTIESFYLTDADGPKDVARRPEKIND